MSSDRAEKPSPHRIDVHHHLFPPAFVTKLVEHKHYLAQGPARHWTPAVSIEDMDRANVATAITSITAPGFSFVEPALLQRLTRECNDYGAKMVADHPGRFGLFAGLPLPDVDASLVGIEYAPDVFNPAGRGLFTRHH